MIPALIRWGIQSAVSAAQSVAAWFMTETAAIRAGAVYVAQTAVMVAKWAWLGVQALFHAAKVAVAWLIALGPIALIVAAVAAAAVLIVVYWDEISSAVTGAVRWVIDFVKSHWEIILSIIAGPIGLAVALIVDNWATIVGVFQSAIGFVVDIWTTGWNAVWGALQAVWATITGFLTALPGAVIGYFTGAVSWLYNAGADIIGGLWNGLKAVWGDVTGWLGGIPGAILGYFTNGTTWLLQSGKDIVTGLWDGIKNIWESVVQWFKDLPGKVLDALGIHSPPEWAVDAGEWILKGITKGLGLGVGSVVNFMKGIAGRFVGPLKDAWDGAFAAVVGGNFLELFGGSFVELGRNMAASMGWTGAQFEALNRLWGGESGWNPSARNPSSGAYGIPQALPASKMGAQAQASNSDIGSRAAAQIHWGLGYIQSVYGTPVNALNKWLARAPHWYEQGAWRTGNEFARLHADEMVLPARIADHVRGALAGSSTSTGGGALVEQHNYGITDIGELARQTGAEVAWARRVAG
jgi:hypothetical protein